MTYGFGQTKCSKCGGGVVPNFLQYHNEMRAATYCGTKIEHLHYTCGRCGFDWETYTKDHEPDEPMAGNDTVDSSAA